MRKLVLILLLLSPVTINAQQATWTPFCSGSNDTLAFTNIITAIGANTGTIRLPYKAGTRCAVNSLTIPANVTLDNTDGTGIKVNTGQTLTVIGTISNPTAKQLFYNATAGLGTVVLTGNTKMRGVQAEWWGTGAAAETAAFVANVTLSTAPTFIPNAAGTKWIFANSLPGANICAKVNAAVTILDGVGGTIYADGGGDCQTTQIHVKANMRLILGAGTYFSQLPNYTSFGVGALVVVDSDATFEGVGWSTILKETTVAGGDSGAWKVVMASAGAVLNGSTARNIHFRNFQIQGAKPDFNSSGGTVDLGNCHHCSATGIFLNGTKSIGLHAGATSTAGTDPGPDLAARGVVTPLGRFSDDITFDGNLLRGVASQNIAFVNTRNSRISNNQIISPGQAGGPGCTPIDIEPNAPTDLMHSIVIENNLIDNSVPAVNVNSGIIVQNTNGLPGYGPIIVRGNSIIGSFLSDGSGNHITTALIYVLVAENVHVLNNYLQRGEDCVRLESSSGGSVKGNTLNGCGFTGSLAMRITDSSNFNISDNMIAIDPTDALQAGEDRSIVESGTSTNNLYANNVATVMTLAGTSKATHVFSFSGGFNFGAPSGATPFTVTAGTLKVANLDSDKLDGTDWAAPGAIGGGTPAAGTFTALTSTSGALNGSIGATTPAAGTFTTATGNTSVISPLFRSTVAKVLLQGTGTGPTQLATTQTTPPTCSTNCGTSPSVSGTDTFMTVTMGGSGSPASGWVITFNGTWAAAPACTVTPALAGMVVGKTAIVVATTATTVTVTTNGTAPGNSDKYHVVCGGIQ